MTIRLKTGSSLGVFAKGNGYAVSLNFGTSGGRHCDTGCAHHPQSTIQDAPKDCYAFRNALRGDRKGLLAKLIRHEALSPSQVLGKAMLELQGLVSKGKRIDWVRISTDGAVPAPGSRSYTKLFLSQFRAFLSYCKQNNITVHFPTETFAKAEGYREELGDLACVRESIQHPEAFADAPGAVSTSTGKGLPLLQRIEVAKALATERREKTGRKTIVCPAVCASFRLKLARTEEEREGRRELANKAKCGNCRACGLHHIDIVYPAH